MKTKLPILIILLIIYFLLKYYIPYGIYIVYPINLLVTFLHEFGHAFFALITGGEVGAIQINSDGSGTTSTAGGWRILILMGGYIGSALFGNILLYLGAKKEKISKLVIYFLSGLIIFTGIFWFNSIVSTIILFLIALLLIFIANKVKNHGIVLQFLGITTLLYIIEDFNVGPSSDLSKFSEIFIIVPQFIWMYSWLFLVIIITGLNIRILLKK